MTHLPLSQPIFITGIALFFFAGGCAGPSYQMPTAYHQKQTLDTPNTPRIEASPSRAEAKLREPPLDEPSTSKLNTPQLPDGRPAVADLLTLLEGSVIVANDGQPLGVITQNEFATNSILNQFGKYGSEFSSTSIFNDFGKYGGEFSRLSPFHEFTRTPPQIISRDGKLVAYLTKNKFMNPAVDPNLLIGLLKAKK